MNDEAYAEPGHDPVPAGEPHDIEPEVPTADPTDHVDQAAAHLGQGQTAEDAVAEAVELARRFEHERDEYLDLARRVQAEFENYKRRVEGQRVEQIERAGESLVRELLPVLDTCELALAQGADEVRTIAIQLVGTLEKQGLELISDSEVPFDPNRHEAVMSEPGDDDKPMVAELLRSGYLWNGRVLRPAMVKVRG